MSGSRGEANFVWRCKSCKVPKYHNPLTIRNILLNLDSQRESTATIVSAPKVYDQSSPPKKQNIVDIDCRGLEFIDFQANVCKHDLRQRVDHIDFSLGRMERQRR